MSELTLMGREVDDMSRDELIAAISFLGYELRKYNDPLWTGIIKNTPAPPEVPLRRCMRCGERVRVEGDTVLCDGVVSKLAPLSTHVPVSPTLLGYPVRFVEPEAASVPAPISPQDSTDLQSAFHKLDRISGSLYEESDDIGQGAPRDPKSMREFLCSCGAEIRNAIVVLGYRGEKG